MPPPVHPAPAHEIAHLSDGLYGNATSWLGEAPGPVSGKVFAGIYFTDGDRELAQVAFGRDNTGVALDRTAGIYEIQVTQDAFNPADDAAVDGAAWTTLGFAELCASGSPLRRARSRSAARQQDDRVCVSRPRWHGDAGHARAAAGWLPGAGSAGIGRSRAGSASA